MKQEKQTPINYLSITRFLCLRSVKTIFRIGILTGLYSNAFSQDIKPASPSAGMVESKGVTTVDYSTGTMSYNIPLFNIKQDGLTLPISLTYTAKGIKVNDGPGLVGYGWTLNTGASAIVRTMRGSSFDEHAYYGILFNDPFSDMTGVNSNKRDGESDIFTLSLMGRKVSFFLRKIDSGNLGVCPLEETPIKIVCHFEPNRNRIVGWTVTDELGNVFKFDASQESGVLVNSSAPLNSYANSYISSWFVSNIKVLNKGDIEFIYEDANDYKAVDRQLNTTLAFYNPPIYQNNIEEFNAELNALLRQLNDRSLANRLLKNIEIIDNKIDYLNRTNYRVMVSAPNLGVNDLAISNYYDQFKEISKELAAVNIADRVLESKIYEVLYKMFAFKEVNFTENTSSGVNYFSDKFLKEIKFKDGSVELGSHKENFWGGQSLVYDKVIYKVTGLTKTAVFETNSKGYLKKVLIEDEKEYSFDYYNEDLFIYKWDNDQDYWGFYSGNRDNKSLIPLDPLAIAFSSYSSAEAYRRFALFPVSNRPDQAVNSDFLITPPTESLISPTFSTRKLARINPNEQNYGAIARSLKSVTSSLGYLVQFEYEGNEVYLPEIDNNEKVGGIRIKSIETKDNFSPASKISYRYKFPLLSDPSKERSTGLIDEWGQWSFVYPYSHSGNKEDLYIFSSPVYLGTRAENNSNNGFYYHYVEEVYADGSFTAYKYPAVFQYKLHYSTPQSPLSLGNLLMAKIDYDNQGKIKKVIRNQYSYDLSLLGNRSDELSVLATKFPYFVSEGYRIPKFSLAQLKKEPVFYNLKEVSDVGRSGSENSFVFGKTVFSSNQGKLFEQNFKPRASHIFIGKMKPYKIESGGHPVLRQQEEFLFGNYDQAQSSFAVNPAGLPDEKAYLYERVINTNGLPVVKNTTTYYYDNLDYTFPTKIEKENSNGERLITRMNYVQDYKTVTATDAVSQGIRNLINLNVIAPIIEKSIYKVNASGVNCLLSASFTSYKPGVALPDKVLSIENETPLNDFSVSKVQGGSIIKDSRYKEQLSFNLYDDQGNLQEKQAADGSKEVFLWGYKGQYLVADISGSSFNEIKPFFNQNTLNTGNKLDIADELNKLRSGLTLSSAFVSTFTYSPQIGKTSETDPSGRTIKYEYNYYSDGKLSSIQDQKGNLVKHYSYSKPTVGKIYSNLWKHAEFIRKKDQIPVTYSVSDGKYLGIVSQKEVDQLAEEELYIKGPVYADAAIIFKIDEKLLMDLRLAMFVVEISYDNNMFVPLILLGNGKFSLPYFKLRDDLKSFSLKISINGVSDIPSISPYNFFVLNPGNLKLDIRDFRYDSVSGTFSIQSEPHAVKKGESYTLTLE